MIRLSIALTLAAMVIPSVAVAAEPVTEDFESGYSAGEPLRVHADWFFMEDKQDPTTEEEAGVGDSFGVAKGDRCFTWIAHPFSWNDPELASVTVGGDWQTDDEGRLDDDRAGWAATDATDSSDNVFGVQMDPGGDGESGMNIECYWDGEKFGDDAGRASIVDLPELKPDTWYRLRATFTKLTASSAKIDVTFTELDDEGEPTGEPTTGTVADTAAMAEVDGGAVPNSGYFSPESIWPVLKNYHGCDGGFDNAFFQIETTSGEAAEPAATVEPEPAPAIEEPAPAAEPAVEEEEKVEAEPAPVIVDPEPETESP